MTEIPLIKFPCALLIFTCHLQKELRFYVPLIIAFQEKAICQQQQNKLIFHISTQNGAFNRELARDLAKKPEKQRRGNIGQAAMPILSISAKCNKVQ